MTMSIMAQEAKQAPHVIAKQLAFNAEKCAALGTILREMKPRMLMIIGRGSSDHAGVFAKYLFEVSLGLPVCAAAPSVSSVFDKTLQLEGAVAIVISQSGRSPDILKQAQAAKEGGAYTIALVNDPSSPLKLMVDQFVPLCAGEEKAVAATKSYLATLSALLQICAHWKQDEDLLNGLNQLPSALAYAIEAPKQLTIDQLAGIKNAVVLGRGFGYAVGREVALKLKEVLSIHAEAFSSAEFIHGPVTLAENALDVFDLQIEDESWLLHKSMMEDVANRGATMHVMTCAYDGLHPRLQPLLVLQRFYLDIESIAVEMGLNPDEPPGLNKVTKTV